MSLQRIAPWLVLALIASVAVMVLGAGRGDRMMTLGAASLYSLAVVAVGLAVNRPAWRDPARYRDDAVGMVRRNTRLAALVYAWGAAAMLSVYSLSGLYWLHGWQYGSAMALIAGGLLIYVHRLGGQSATPPLALTALHGLAAAGGLGYLASTGKMFTHRPDWAANLVFLVGGLSIVAICLMAYVTQSRIGRSGRA